MCLFCENSGYCITSIEKIRWMCFVLWVSSQPRRSTLCIPNPVNFLDKQKESIPGPRKGDGWCLCFDPGLFPVAHTGCGTVQGSELMVVAHHPLSEVSPAPLNFLHSQPASHSVFGYFSAPVLRFSPRVLPFSQLRAEPIPQLLVAP